VKNLSQKKKTRAKMAEHVAEQIEMKFKTATFHKHMRFATADFDLTMCRTISKPECVIHRKLVLHQLLRDLGVGTDKLLAMADETTRSVRTGTSIIFPNCSYFVHPAPRHAGLYRPRILYRPRRGADYIAMG
jgi:hypothetical protein